MEENLDLFKASSCLTYVLCMCKNQVDFIMGFRGIDYRQKHWGSIKFMLVLEKYAYSLYAWIFKLHLSLIEDETYLGHYMV